MRRIKKYGPLTNLDGHTVDYGPHHVVKMPIGAKVIHVGPDTLTDELMVWAIVDDNHPMTDRHFIVAATGDPMEEVEGLYTHVGSACAHHLMFHVFAVWETP